MAANKNPKQKTIEIKALSRINNKNKSIRVSRTLIK